MSLMRECCTAAGAGLLADAVLPNKQEKEISRGNYLPFQSFASNQTQVKRGEEQFRPELAYCSCGKHGAAQPRAAPAPGVVMGNG